MHRLPRSAVLLSRCNRRQWLLRSTTFCPRHCHRKITSSTSFSSFTPSSSSSTPPSASTSLFPPLSPAALSHLSSLASLIRTGHRPSLSRAITLLESTLPSHQAQANHLLQLLSTSPPSSPTSPPRRSLRIGVSGPPGAGKSTFIEALGQFIVDGSVQSTHSATHSFSSSPHPSAPPSPPSLPSPSPSTQASPTPAARPLSGTGDRLAILTIDPTSHLTGGSILGDRTRMPLLSSHHSVYIRPSPSKLSLGGVHPSTYSALHLCHAAGYNVQLIETVGVGQSEAAVRPMVDCLLLLLPPGGGDELQGMKRGLIEVADFLVVTKADGQLLGAARHAAADYKQAVALRGAGEDGWRPEVLMVSSVEAGGEGVGRVWERVKAFDEWLGEERKRRRRGEAEVRVLMHEVPQLMWQAMRGSERGRRVVERVEGQVASGELDVRRGAQRIVEKMMQGWALPPDRSPS